MRTTIIPAQITTVEDKIAGSLNMTQILILMAPVLGTALIYALLPPTMKLVIFKLVLILLMTAICLVLALRVKEKIVAEWLMVLLRYQLRPRKYLFNKNDLTNRTVDIPEIPLEHLATKKAVKKQHQKNKAIKFTDLVRLQHLIDSGKLELTYQFKKNLA